MARVHIGTAVAVVMLATVAVATAGDGRREQLKFNPADQAAARSAVLRRADLPGGDWKGGAIKFDLSPSPTCRNYHPDLSDFVLTGAAESNWKSETAEMSVDSGAQVLQTARMVAQEWRRTLEVPSAVPCLRRLFAKSLPSEAKLISFRRITIPHIAPYAFAFLAKIDYTEPTTADHLILDSEFISLGRGRTEITLSVQGVATYLPGATESTVSAQARSLARILVRRAH